MTTELKNEDGLIEEGGFSINQAQRRVNLNGQEIFLRPKEFDVLVYLINHPKCVHTRENLLKNVWGYPSHMNTRTVDVHIRTLRKKIETNPSNPKTIETVHGVGYRFNLK